MIRPGGCGVGHERQCTNVRMYQRHPGVTLAFEIPSPPVGDICDRYM